LDRFFTIAYDIELGSEAKRKGIDVIVAYVADPSDMSQRTYAALRARFPEFSFVPVFNDWLARGLDFRSHFPASSGGVHAVNLPQMPAAVHAIADRHPFSFNEFLRRPPSIAPRALIDDVNAFRKRVFRQLRETELSLLLNRLRLTLSAGPAAEAN
ncbi:MAG TPA: hypothetical protein VM867_06990, partial [Xanthobacteraceae bacterium]|nr:hypothetical protein [Xanthobacteraceae bacterium]